MLRHIRAGWSVLSGLTLLFIGIGIGERYGLYYRIANFDKLLHLTGGIIAAWFVLALLQDELVRMTAWKQILILVGITAFIGVMWEWAEFISNFTQYTNPTWYHYFHGGDLGDTLGDLLADTAGAIFFALWALRKERMP